jgi:imidazolonepropionase-like amidohydrolase
MIPYLEGKKTVFLHVSSAEGIRKAVTFAEEQKLKIVIADAQEAWRVADLLAKKQIPVLYTPPLVNSVSSGSQGREYDPYDTAFAAPALLQKAGVKFCFQSNDSAIARNLPGQVGIACAFGLPAEAALRAMTLSAAEILGIADRVGSLEVGKQADILVTNGDPLDATTSLRYLFIAGKPVSLETKHTQLYARYLQRLSEIPNLPKGGSRP